MASAEILRNKLDFPDQFKAKIFQMSKGLLYPYLSNGFKTLI